MLVFHFDLLYTFTSLFHVTLLLMFPREMVSSKGITPECSLSIDEPSPLCMKSLWTTGVLECWYYYKFESKSLIYHVSKLYK